MAHPVLHAPNWLPGLQLLVPGPAGGTGGGQLRQLVQNGGLIQCFDSSSTGVCERPSGDTEQCFNGSSTGLHAPRGGGDETGHHIASWADHWSLGSTRCPTPPQSGELRSHEMCQLGLSCCPSRVSCQWTIRKGALQSPRSTPVANWGSSCGAGGARA